MGRVSVCGRAPGTSGFILHSGLPGQHVKNKRTSIISCWRSENTAIPLKEHESTQVTNKTAALSAHKEFCRISSLNSPNGRTLLNKAVGSYRVVVKHRPPTLSVIQSEWDPVNASGGFTSVWGSTGMECTQTFLVHFANFWLFISKGKEQLSKTVYLPINGSPSHTNRTSSSLGEREREKQLFPWTNMGSETYFS